MRDKRAGLLSAIFSKAQKLKIDISEDGDLRTVIVPNLTGKRLSECNTRELFRVIEHLVAITEGENYQKRFTPGLAGLKQEIVDLARERFGEDFVPPLNALCCRFGVKRYQWLKLKHAKAVKEALIRLQKEGPYRRD